LADVDTVIHCAAYVHQSQASNHQQFRDYFRVNRDGTLRLAQEAVRLGIRRFIFLSTIKVNGESTSLDSPFDSTCHPHPLDPYGLSKWQAEQGLHEISNRTGLEVVVIRPPLVYGPGVKANFFNLMVLVSKGLPLPFAAIHNKRSLLSLDNLVDLLVLCIDHAAAVGRTFLVSDGEDLSTPQLIRLLSQSMRRSPRLFWMPPAMLRLVGYVIGRSQQVNRLLDSLQVDGRSTLDALNWSPPFKTSNSIQATVDWFADTYLSSK
jgi:UDP-glucose 4-epimerase